MTCSKLSIAQIGFDHKKVTYSFAAGVKTEEVIVVDEKADLELIKVTPSAAFFIDKNNSLLFSFVVSTRQVYKENIRLDIYPSILKFNKITFGVWANFSFKQESYIGITLKGLPGIGSKYSGL